jgi:hypothetical protein
MNETAVKTATGITVEQKQAALEAVLQSHTFARADQLKSFLKFVCEMELSGRGAELSEYLIGVEALGRPTSYSPGDDSAVRNRAFALRKKLQEFYELEQPEAALRIELTKGSYCPHFVEGTLNHKSDEALTTPLTSQLVPLTRPTASLAQTPQREKRSLLFAFVAGVVVTAAMAGVLYWLSGTRRNALAPVPTLAPILAEAWGPILVPNADVLVCVANPPSLSVHPSKVPLPASTPTPLQFNDQGGRPLPAELRDWYKTKYPLLAENLYLTLTTNATYWGDSLGAMTALKIMHAANVAPQMFPEKVITVPTLRRRNVVLFGAPEYSPAVARFLDRCPLTVNFLDAIVDAESEPTPSARYGVKRDQQNRMTQLFGLITVLPSESSVNHRTIIFSGVNSAGTQAAAEFFASPEHLLELKNHLKKDGHDTFPAAYQVVVRAETDESILLNFRYETYRVIAPPTSH